MNGLLSTFSARLASAALLLALLASAGCSYPTPEKPKDQRQHLAGLCDATLTELCALQPGLRERVDSAPGYALISDRDTRMLWVEAGEALATVVNHATGARTYLRLQELNARGGFGMKEFEALYLFQDAAALEGFLAKASAPAGWRVMAGTSLPGVEILVSSERGLEKAPALVPAKYYRDADLNER